MPVASVFSRNGIFLDLPGGQGDFAVEEGRGRFQLQEGKTQVRCRKLQGQSRFARFFRALGDLDRDRLGRFRLFGGGFQLRPVKGIRGEPRSSTVTRKKPPMARRQQDADLLGATLPENRMPGHQWLPGSTIG